MYLDTEVVNQNAKSFNLRLSLNLTSVKNNRFIEFNLQS